MKARNAANQFQLIPENLMPFNLAGETLPPEQPPQETKQNTETQPNSVTETV